MRRTRPRDRIRTAGRRTRTHRAPGAPRPLWCRWDSKGALLATSTESQRFAAIPMRAVSGVGAGDAMVAAITVGLTRGWPLSKSVRFGIAAGAAMMMTPGTVPCTRADTERLFEIAEEPVDVGVVCA